MLSDLKFALRVLAKSPGFTAAAITILALGIGATTAIFSIVNAVVLRPLAYAHPGELLQLRCVIPAVAREYPTIPVNARFYTEWQACPAFAELALIDRGRATLTGAGEPLRLSTVLSSSNLFSTLGVAPALGRAFTADEAASAPSAVALISDHLWRSRFSADPAVVGRSITLNLKPVTVIGVLPARFRVPGSGSVSEPDLYLPRTFGADELNGIIGMFNYEVIGRLAPGATRSDAEAQMNVVAARLCQQAHEGTDVRGTAIPLQTAVVGDARRGLWILLGAIAAVLMLACLNLGILGLARAERRSHDSAIRAALGASPGRLLVHSLAESLLLSLAGGTLGCLVAWWLLDALIGLAPSDLPRVHEARIDLVVLLFALAATLLTTVLAGLVPAWHTARRGASATLLASNSGRVTSGRGARRLRATLIALEIAVSTVLLAAAALLIVSFDRVLRTDVGFRAPTTLTTSVTIPRAKYSEPAQIVGYYQRVIAALSATPGVVSAAVTNLLPLNGQTWIDGVHVAGDTRPAMQQPQANVRFVSPDYFKTLGIPLSAGRSFRDDDDDHAVIVSARLAATLWPGQDAIGRKVLRGDGQAANEFVVVGVAGDARTNVDQRPVAVLYRVLQAWPMTELSLAIRLDGAPAGAIPSVRRALQSVDAEVPLQAFRTMEDIFSSAVAPRRFQMRLVATFALSALTLAALGIYAVVSHSVSLRRRELGIRLAFGAPPGALSRLVLRQSLKPITLGLGAGLITALLGGQLLASFLYETSPRDPLSLALVASGLFTVATLACWLPARRATRVDPMVALRAE
jgi:putative ABC transport system permease protein